MISSVTFGYLFDSAAQTKSLDYQTNDSINKIDTQYLIHEI